MRDDIDNLITMLRTDLQSSMARALNEIDDLAAALAGASDGGDTSQSVLLDAIKSQVGVATSEVERFDNVVRGQIGIAQAYAQSLVKEG